MATRCTSPNKASLLPYLHGVGEEARLTLSLYPDIPSYQDRAYPFVVLDDTDATSRLIEARFITDAGSLLKKIFILVQKDQYTLHDDEQRSVTNSDIDSAWQTAFSSFKEQLHDGSRLVLSAQIDEQGRQLRLASLFYCRERRLFFHPVCPSCGLSLNLCTNDALLERHGLQTYSASSKRYLYCSSCCNLGAMEFYLFDRESTDPVSIRDRWSLIDRFRFVSEEKDPDGTFPCARCPEHENCYGPGLEARIRITPFSFYPFYLLFYDAPSLHALDFMQLASGATVEELEKRLNLNRCPGRIEYLRDSWRLGHLDISPFPCDDERLFLALLYLKLSLLREVLRRYMALHQMGITAASDNVWVHVEPRGNTLPISREFSLEIIENVTPHTSSGTVNDAVASPFGRAGSLWFQVLLQNRSVSQGEILNAVRRYLMHLPGTTQTTDLGELCVPENIFWDSVGRNIRSEWLYLWKKGCEFGFLLLDAASSRGKQTAVNDMISALDALLAEIKDSLFSSPPAPASWLEPSRVDVGCDDQVLLGIVKKMIEKCRAEIQAFSAYQPSEIDDEEVATVILSSQKPSERKPLPPEDDMIIETVVLTPPQSLSQRISPPSQKVSADEELLETVLLTPGGMGRPDHNAPVRDANASLITQQAPPPGNEADRLGETVILGPRPTSQTESPRSHEISPDERLEETVVLAPIQTAQPTSTVIKRVDVIRPTAPPSETGSDKDDQLGETVVIMPPKRKDLSKKQ